MAHGVGGRAHVLARDRRGIRGAEGVSAFTSLGFWWLGRDHPLYQVVAFRDFRREAAVYVRVPRLADLLSRLRPALERRLAASPLAGHSADLRLGFYRSGVRLRIEEGTLTHAEEWTPPFDTIGQEPSYGGVSVFNPNGSSVSPPPYGFSGCPPYTGIPEPLTGCAQRVQDVAVDQQNNIWLASYENGLVVVFPGGLQPDGTIPPAISAPIPDGFKPFGIAIAPDGTAWVTASSGLWAYTASNLSRFRFKDGQLTCVHSRRFGRALKGLAIDSQGNVWVPSGGDDVVFLLDSEGKHCGRYKGGGIDGPWGVAVDGNDNIWVANFGKMLPCADYTDAAISCLAGAIQETRPEGFEIGEAISPPTGYTLPTGGAQVRLRNGDPLYGKDEPPCHSPLMRLTNVAIDRAGNVWAVNNWKPNFNTDFSPKRGNPGGDGIVIFVGLAKPPKPQS